MNISRISFSNIIIISIIFLSLFIVACGVLKNPPAPDINPLNGKYIDTHLLEDMDNEPFKITNKSLIHIHADFCNSCIEDKKLFLETHLKNRLPVIGLKWIEKSNSYFNADLDKVYSKIIKAKNTDFFVKLGMKTVPLTLVVGINGQILYAKLGRLEKSIIYNEIIPIIDAK